VVGSYAPFLLPVLVGVARYRRGRRIRLGKTRSKNPITGEWGEKVGVEGLVQTAANFATAMFEVGPDGSGLKRTWKTVAAGSLAALLMTVPGIREWATAHAPAAAGIWTLVTAFVLGVEKELKKVLPVEERVNSPQPA